GRPCRPATDAPAAVRRRAEAAVGGARVGVACGRDRCVPARRPAAGRPAARGHARTVRRLRPRPWSRLHAVTTTIRAMPTLPLTLLVITHNEAGNIARCLDSVPFAAEKLVVDSGSTDDTVAIARAHGARVVHQDWRGFGPQRNFATTQAAHDWILALDADEYLGGRI